MHPPNSQCFSRHCFRYFFCESLVIADAQGSAKVAMTYRMHHLEQTPAFAIHLLIVALIVAVDLIGAVIVAVAIAAPPDEPHAFGSGSEGARVSKVHKAAVPAVADTPWRTTSALIIRDTHRKRAALRGNEHVVLLDVLRAEITGSMDTAAYLLESLPSGVRFRPAASILDGDRAAFDDTDEKPRVKVPAAHLAGRDDELSRCHCGRAVNEFRVRKGADTKYGGSRRIRDNTEKNYDAKADNQRQPVSQRFHSHL